MNTPTSIHGNGMVVATGLGPQQLGHQQNLQGGLLIHAANKSIESTLNQAGHAKAGGVNMRGGAALSIPSVPEGGTIPGVSFAGNHANLINIANQAQANKTYDGLAGGQPYHVQKGGRNKKRTFKRSRRIPDLKERREEFVVSAGGKRRRKTKRHGNRNRRNKSRYSMGKSRRRNNHSRRVNRTN